MLLQSASGITKCHSYYKVRHNKDDILKPLFFNLFINDLTSWEKQSTRSEESETPKLSNARISSLVFSCDLEMFSLTQHGLQEN